MTILVVEDYEALREMLADMIRNEQDGIEVLEAGTLDKANELLPQADAVLCDGSFPTHLRRCKDGEPGIVENTNWAPLMNACQRLGVPFVLLSAQGDLVIRLKMQGHAAFEKPNGSFTAVRTVVQAAQANGRKRKSAAL